MHAAMRAATFATCFRTGATLPVLTLARSGLVETLSWRPEREGWRGVTPRGMIGLQCDEKIITAGEEEQLSPAVMVVTEESSGCIMGGLGHKNTMNINLTPEQEKLVENELKSGHFNTVEEVIGEAPVSYTHLTLPTNREV